MLNPNDNVRDKILRYLYDVHRQAKGLKSIATGVQDLQGTMKKNYGIKRPDVNSNLDYLLQKGWVKETVEPQIFRTPQGTLRQVSRKKYKISALGIDRLEAASIYHREESFARINVTNVHGVTVIGERNNIVNTESTDLARTLSELEKSIEKSNSLSDEEKINTLGDLATIQGQLAKTKPDKNIIRRVWAGIEQVVTGAEFVELVTKASLLIAQLVASGSV